VVYALLIPKRLFKTSKYTQFKILLYYDLTGSEEPTANGSSPKKDFANMLSPKIHIKCASINNKAIKVYTQKVNT